MDSSQARSISDSEFTTIDVVSDVVCPWCYIGKRHLETAIHRFKQAMPHATAPQVRWLPFQLNPQLPQEGVPRKDYLEQKFGGPERAKEIYARVSSAGRAAGIEFDFERIQIQPNTLNAHRLIHIAGGLGKQDAMVEALFQAYFLEGADLTQIGTLKTLAQRADIDPQAVSDHLASDEDQSMVQDLDREARRMGISGVPFFIFNRRYAVSGAQPPDVLLRTLHQAFTQASLTG